MALIAFQRLWLYLRQNPPTLLVGSVEFLIGGILFTSLFRYFVRVFTTLKIQKGQSLSYYDSVALSCKLVSAIFACMSCAMGIISKWICPRGHPWMTTPNFSNFLTILPLSSHICTKNHYKWQLFLHPYTSCNLTSNVKWLSKKSYNVN